MEVQILDFTYDKANVEDIEAQINNYLNHHEVQEIKITQWEDKLLVFFFYEA